MKVEVQVEVGQWIQGRVIREQVGLDNHNQQWVYMTLQKVKLLG